MSGVEKISLSISNKIGDKLGKSKEEIAVINYGLFIIIHTSLIIITLIIIGVLTNTIKEVLVISLCSALLKRYSGGIHASSPMKCLMLSVIMTTGLAILCKICTNSFDNISITVLLIIGLVIEYIVLYTRCPVSSRRKQLKNKNKIKLLRKKSFKIMNIYSLIILVLCITYTINNSLLAKTLSISILFGAFIQIFALSKIGERIIMKLDRISFNNSGIENA